ncbi:MAG: prepilin-type N-terminal cleavage/methylation domain-containing protein [Ramlibacter sp.]|nr:prepilin-type N-terminal cleavage/methylation domain-containing protein [Ramlibacter sp.]
MRLFQRSTDGGRQQGFGLLEVLIALVLFSGVGIVLLAWLQQNLTTTQRLRDVYEEVRVKEIALTVVRGVNVMKTPEGERRVGNLLVRWQADPVGDEVPQFGYPLGVGRHTLRLYRTRVTVSRDEETQPWIADDVILVGHRLTVSPRDGG